MSKIMDYIKNQKEAIAIVKQMIADGQISQEVAEKYFPELKESEDERIRKALIDIVNARCELYKGITKEMFLAWLEKQSEQKLTNIVTILDDYFATTSKEQQDKDWEELKHLNDIGPDIEIVFGTKDSELEGKQGEKKPAFDVEIPFGAKDSELIEATYFIPKGFHAEIDGDKVVIKKGEQKSAWSEEDDEMVQVAINACNSYQDSLVRSDSRFDKAVKAEDWLKSLKDRVQPKQEWSKEDEDNFKHLMDEIVCLGNSRNSAERLHYDRLIKFLDELKNRVQPREEWCDKDERMLDRLIAYFEKRVAFTDDDNPRYANWLKSLRPQNHWKPSDEQMEALDFAADCIVPDEFCNKKKYLKSLLTDLNKLRG